MTARSIAPKVSLVILNHNQYEVTRDCLKSLKEVCYPAFDVILVDNGSTDGSGERLRCEFPYIEIVPLPENLGPSGGRNAGVRAALDAEADYVLFLDNDTVVSPRFLTELVAAAEGNPAAGAVSPAILIFDRPNEVFSLGGIYYPRLAHGRLRYVGRPAADIPQEIIDSDWLGTGALLCRRALLDEIGFFDEDLLRSEDLEWGLRVRRAGYKLYAVPSAVVWHKRLPGVARNAAVARQWARSHVIFLRKDVHFCDWLLAVCFFVFYLLIIRRIVPFAFHKQWDAIKELLLGLKDGLAYQL